MTKTQKKRSVFAKFRNYFIAGVVVLIPIGITIYLTLFIITISSKLLPKDAIDTASYFGFYDVSEKIGIVIGMFSYGYIAQKYDSRTAILCFMTFFILGVILLLRVPKTKF